MAKRAELEIDLKVEFIPLLPEREAVWRAGLLLLLNFMARTCDVAKVEPFLLIEQFSEAQK